MGASNVGGGSSGGPGSRSGQGPTGVQRSTQTGGIPPVSEGENPLHIPYPETGGHDVQPGSAEPTRPPRDIMRVTLLIPEDEYEAWSSKRPNFIKIIKTEILDKIDRERLGLE